MAEIAVSSKVLPVGSKSHHASGWWAVLTVVATEGALFSYLIFSYFYIASHSASPWPPFGAPDMKLAIPGTIILIAGSFTMMWGEHGIRRGQRWRLVAGIAATLVLGIAFIVLEAFDWLEKPFVFGTDVYSSLYFTITGFHLAHVVIGLILLAVLLVWTAFGYFGETRHAAVSIGTIYWHFVTVVWLFVFSTFFIAPRLG